MGEISYVNAFGHTMPAIVRPSMRRLTLKNPRCIANYIKVYKQFIITNSLLERAKELETKSLFPLSPALIKEYEILDNLRCKGMALAERKCRKICAGQVAFSPTLQTNMREIKAWMLLTKYARGLKVSTRLLKHSMKMASIHPSIKTMV
jgi:hypothetical protein